MWWARGFFLPSFHTQPQPLLTPEGLEALAKECGRELDLQSTQLLGEIADDFVESVTVFAAEIAKHRGGTEITSRDVQSKGVRPSPSTHTQHLTQCFPYYSALAAQLGSRLGFG